MKPFRDTKMKTFRQFLEEVEAGKEIVPPKIHDVGHPEYGEVLQGIKERIDHERGETSMEDWLEENGHRLHGMITSEHSVFPGEYDFEQMKRVSGGEWTENHTNEAIRRLRKQQEKGNR